MAKGKKKSNTGSHHYVAWGAGIGALAAGAAGAYFLYGTKEGKKQRKRLSSWVVRMKGDVMAKLENLKEVNEKAYHDVVDTVAARYKKLKTVDAKELSALVSDMKRHWKNIQKDVHGSAAKKTTRKRSSTQKKRSSSKKAASKKQSAAKKK